MSTKPKKLLSHQQLINKMLKNPSVKSEVKRLNGKEFAILDEVLAAKEKAAVALDKRVELHLV
jgi:hypothetical protein